MSADNLTLILRDIESAVSPGTRVPGHGGAGEIIGRVAASYMRAAFLQGKLVELAIKIGDDHHREASITSLRAILDVFPDMYSLDQAADKEVAAQTAFLHGFGELLKYQTKYDPGSPESILAKSIVDRLSVEWPAVASAIAKAPNYWFARPRSAVLEDADAWLSVHAGTPPTSALRSAYKLLSWDAHNILAPIQLTDEDATGAFLTRQKGITDLTGFVSDMAALLIAGLWSLYQRISADAEARST